MWKMRAAPLASCQALEADGLHFQTDVWSSAVVIFGLVAAKVGYPAADSIAAGTLLAAPRPASMQAAAPASEGRRLATRAHT